MSTSTNTATTDPTRQSVLITGAFSGLGYASAIAFARRGANLIVSGRRTPEQGATLVKELLAAGASRVEFVHADVTQEAHSKLLVDRALELFGRLDVALNNAGFEGKFGVTVADQTVESYRAVFDTNVLGVLLGLKYQLPVMIKQGSGAIINVTSVAGHLGVPGASVYVASKHAVEGLTKTAALEAAPHGVRVNSIAPGAFRSVMFNRVFATAEAAEGFASTLPQKKLLAVEDLAETIIFLGRADVTGITGHSLVVDGAYSAQ